MPDSQNKQGEQAMKCAICGTKYSDCNPITNGICGYCEADRRNALRRQGIDPDQPLLSQQHAPSKKAGERNTPKTDEVAKMIGRLAFQLKNGELTLPDFADVAQVELDKLGAIERLATELTKGREDLKPYEEELDHCDKLIEQFRAQGDMYGVNFHEGRKSGIIEGDIIQSREKAALRQQLAEAKEFLASAQRDANEWNHKWEANQTEKINLRSQLIALSAVVEKMKRGLESIVHECGINPTGRYYIIAHAATQLLADLGHK